MLDNTWYSNFFALTFDHWHNAITTEEKNDSSRHFFESIGEEFPGSKLGTPPRFDLMVKCLTEQSSPNEVFNTAVPLLNKLSKFYQNAYFHKNKSLTRTALIEAGILLTYLRDMKIDSETLKKVADKFSKEYIYSFKGFNYSLDDLYTAIKNIAETKPSKATTSHTTLAPTPALPTSNFKNGFETLYNYPGLNDEFFAAHFKALCSAYQACGDAIFPFLASLSSAEEIKQFLVAWPEIDDEYFYALRILFANQAMAPNNENWLALIKYLPNYKTDSSVTSSSLTLLPDFAKIMTEPFQWTVTETKSNETWFGLQAHELKYKNDYLNIKWKLALDAQDATLTLNIKGFVKGTIIAQMEKDFKNKGMHVFFGGGRYSLKDDADGENLYANWSQTKHTQEFTKIINIIGHYFVSIRLTRE